MAEIFGLGNIALTKNKSKSKWVQHTSIIETLEMRLPLLELKCDS